MSSGSEAALAGNRRGVLNLGYRVAPKDRQPITATAAKRVPRDRARDNAAANEPPQLSKARQLAGAQPRWRIAAKAVSAMIWEPFCDGWEPSE
jgi:hypothetical protein